MHTGKLLLFLSITHWLVRLRKSWSPSQCLNRINIQNIYLVNVSPLVLTHNWIVWTKQKFDYHIWTLQEQTDAYRFLHTCTHLYMHTYSTCSPCNNRTSCVLLYHSVLFCMNLDGWRFVNVPICGVYMWKNWKCFYEIVCNKLLIQLGKCTCFFFWARCCCGLAPTVHVGFVRTPECFENFSIFSVCLLSNCIYTGLREVKQLCAKLYCCFAEVSMETSRTPDGAWEPLDKTNMAEAVGWNSWVFSPLLCLLAKGRTMPAAWRC